jgi:hypothetical protein
VRQWRGRGQLAQHGVHEWGGGTLARALHQFDALVDGGARRDAVEVAELVESETEGGENFKIEFGNGLRRRRRNFFVEA